MGDGNQNPAPLEYETPQPRRYFEDLLTDFVRQEMAEGRLPPQSRGYRLLMWTRFAALVLLLLAAVLFG